MLAVERFVCGPLENNVYLVTAGDGSCALIDPGIEIDEVFAGIASRRLQVKYVLLTHGHFDHAFSAAEACQRLQAPLAAHPDDLPLLVRLVETAYTWGVSGAKPVPPLDIQLAHGQRLALNGDEIEVRHVPGHCPGHVAFCFPGHTIAGDTLFYRSIGRWDLPGANYHQLERSIREQLFSLPAETTVWPGHGQETNIGDEQRFNPFLGEEPRVRPKL